MSKHGSDFNEQNDKEEESWVGIIIGALLLASFLLPLVGMMWLVFIDLLRQTL